MEAVLGIIGTISGVVIGAVFAWVAKALTDRRDTGRRLKTAAFVCLDRLSKIKNAEDRSDGERRDREIYLLGGDLDCYRDAIALATRRDRKTHWDIYKRIMPILLVHDLSLLNEVIGKLEPVSGVKKK
jgi:hypothetical protein